MRICARWESAMPVEARDVVGGAHARFMDSSGERIGVRCSTIVECSGASSAYSMFARCPARRQHSTWPSARPPWILTPRSRCSSNTAKTSEALPITASPTAATGPVQSCVECAESEQTEAVKTDLAGNTLPQLLRLLLAKQEERVAVYKRFEEGFLLFLQVAEATGYEEL